MNTKDAVDTLHKEHDEMARFLKAFENALELAVSGDDEMRGLGLSGLREIVEKSTRIRGSFPQDSAVLSSPAFRLIEDADRYQLKQSLFRLERASYEFRKELAFTTTFSTEDLVEEGRRLEDILRKELAYEAELLQGIEAVLASDSAPGLNE
jgi:hypothetical protein